jgi:iron complex outermembrane receptor protein
MTHCKYTLATLLLTGTSLCATGNAYAANTTDLMNMSLEELSNIAVTSVSKKAEKQSEAAAAIYVITQEDIRRSGMTSIPELLRMVPGLDVAQSASNQWAVSSRGFNDQLANKLLVLIDGRSVYTPLFSGVYWDVQDTPLQDIDRIEVIRGPGATQWGANAVNGVINIITKTADLTQGGYASQSFGSQINSETTARYGAKLDDNAYARVYAKYKNIDDMENLSNVSARDAWSKMQSGFRADWKRDSGQSFTLQGDVYTGREDAIYNLPAAVVTSSLLTEKVHGANVLGRWTNHISSKSEVALQAYFDEADRDHPVFDQSVKTADIDLQHNWELAPGHEIVWGTAYRLVKTDESGDSYVTFSPSSRSDNLFSAFAQDKITLNPEDLFLTIGSKFEHNDFTGFEYQPSARLSWLISDKQTFWTSVSRAVRTPHVGTSDSTLLLSQVGVGPTIFLAQRGSKDTESEDLIAYEAGYRIQPSSNSSLDFATFYNDYKNLVLGVTDGNPIGPFNSSVIGPYLIIPIYPANTGSAHSWGAELAAKWNPTASLELSAGYSFLDLQFDQLDPLGNSFDGKSPTNQFNARANVKLPYNLEFDTAVYYVDELKFSEFATNTSTDAYTRVDMRLGWKPIENMEVSLIGQNLLDPRHSEFSGFLYKTRSQVPRTVYGNVAWKF